MDAPTFEILSSAPADDDGGPSAPRWSLGPGLRTVVGAVLVAALLVGAAGGVVWARQDERGHRQSMLSVSAVVTAGSRPSADGASVGQQVELAVVNAGPAPLENVQVAWKDVHSTLSNERQPESLGGLEPGRGHPAQLLLVQGCSSAGPIGNGTPPQLAVTATTADGKRHAVTVAPLGLGTTWAAMAASCPDPNAFSSPSVAISTQMTEVLPRGADFKLTFTNPNETDLLISGVRVTQAKGTTITPFAGSIQIFPRASSDLVIRITILDCALALKDGAASALSFDVASANRPDEPRTVKTRPTSYDQALGALLFRSCGPG